jgi:hypothetical protein
MRGKCPNDDKTGIPSLSQGFKQLQTPPVSENAPPLAARRVRSTPELAPRRWMTNAAGPAAPPHAARRPISAAGDSMNGAITASSRHRGQNRVTTSGVCAAAGGSGSGFRSADVSPEPPARATALAMARSHLVARIRRILDPEDLSMTLPRTTLTLIIAPFLIPALLIGCVRSVNSVFQAFRRRGMMRRAAS